MMHCGPLLKVCNTYAIQINTVLCWQDTRDSGVHEEKLERIEVEFLPMNIAYSVMSSSLAKT